MATKNDGPTKAKKKKHFVSFNEEQATKYNCVKKSRKGERFAFCTTCADNFGIGYIRENDVKRRLETLKHKSNVKSLISSSSLTDWGSSTATNKLDEKVTQGELLFSGLIAEYKLSIATADNAGSSFREIFPD